MHIVLLFCYSTLGIPAYSVLYLYILVQTTIELCLQDMTCQEAVMPVRYIPSRTEIVKTKSKRYMRGVELLDRKDIRGFQSSRYPLFSV